MKQKEKDDLLKLIDSSTFPATSYGYIGSVVDVNILKNCINSFPTDKEEIIELYAIKDLVNDEIIWSARGSAYKTMKDAKNRLARLENENRNTLAAYEIVTYKLEK